MSDSPERSVVKSETICVEPEDHGDEDCVILEIQTSKSLPRRQIFCLSSPTKEKENETVDVDLPKAQDEAETTVFDTLLCPIDKQLLKMPVLPMECLNRHPTRTVSLNSYHEWWEIFRRKVENSPLHHNSLHFKCPICQFHLKDPGHLVQNMTLTELLTVASPSSSSFEVTSFRIPDLPHTFTHLMVPLTSPCLPCPFPSSPLTEASVSTSSGQRKRGRKPKNLTSIPSSLSTQQLRWLKMERSRIERAQKPRRTEFSEQEEIQSTLKTRMQQFWDQVAVMFNSSFPELAC